MLPVPLIFFMRNISENLNKKFRIFIVLSGLVLAVVIAGIRYLTGPEFALSLFYLLPICVVTWFAGKRAGVLIAFVSAATWLCADIMMIDAYSRPFIPFLNETLRLVVFLIISLVLSRLKNVLEDEKDSARKDFLTGIANRRSFFELAGIETKRSGRYKTPLTTIYLDLDNFKTINDQFGHHIGDEVLCSVSKTIKRNIRSIDTVARLGGDEFAILLPETGAKSADVVSRKIQKELLDIMETNGWPVTFSMGVATYKKAIGNFNEIIKKADGLMYSVKQDGKNMIKHEVVE